MEAGSGTVRDRHERLASRADEAMQMGPTGPLTRAAKGNYLSVLAKKGEGNEHGRQPSRRVVQ